MILPSMILTPSAIIRLFDKNSPKSHARISVYLSPSVVEKPVLIRVPAAWNPGPKARSGRPSAFFVEKYFIFSLHSFLDNGLIGKSPALCQTQKTSVTPEYLCL